MEYINKTKCYDAIAFAEKKLRKHASRNIRIILSLSKAYDVTGGYTYLNSKDRYSIYAKIPKGKAIYPLGFNWEIATGKRHIDIAYDKDEAAVWVMAHEVWHVFCELKIWKGNYETKANKKGFDWMRQFKKWRKGRRR